MTNQKKARLKTGRKKRTPEKEVDPTKKLLELIRSAGDEGDGDEDESSEEAERLTEKIWAAIRAAIQSGELPGPE